MYIYVYFHIPQTVLVRVESVCYEHIYICICTYAYIYMYIYMYVYIYTYIHIYVYICIYMYVTQHRPLGGFAVAHRPLGGFAVGRVRTGDLYGLLWERIRPLCQIGFGPVRNYLAR